jgi:hypothetical protein
MALFKKKEAKSKVDEALELFNSLSDEELEEFLSKADLDGDGDVDEEDAEETTEETTEEGTMEETTEPTEETTEENSEEPTAEPVEETEEAPTDAEPGETEPSEAEEMPTEEAPTEDAPVEEKTEDIGADKYQALQSQIESLKEAIAGLTARIEADQENKEPETEPFGIGMQNTGKETDDKSDVQRAKEKYWAF